MRCSERCGSGDSEPRQGSKPEGPRRYLAARRGNAREREAAYGAAPPNPPARRTRAVITRFQADRPAQPSDLALKWVCVVNLGLVWRWPDAYSSSRCSPVLSPPLQSLRRKSSSPTTMLVSANVWARTASKQRCAFGTGDAVSDFDILTGGRSGPPAPGSNYPEGTRVGENGVAIRPAEGGDGPRIDIPASGGKPAETLHYPRLPWRR
jgi:hypothetical protein